MQKHLDEILLNTGVRELPRPIPQSTKNILSR